MVITSGILSPFRYFFPSFCGYYVDELNAISAEVSSYLSTSPAISGIPFMLNRHLKLVLTGSC